MANCVVSTHGKILSQWNLMNTCVYVHACIHTYILIHIHTYKMTYKELNKACM